MFILRSLSASYGVSLEPRPLFASRWRRDRDGCEPVVASLLRGNPAPPALRVLHEGEMCVCWPTGRSDRHSVAPRLGLNASPGEYGGSANNHANTYPKNRLDKSHSWHLVGNPKATDGVLSRMVSPFRPRGRLTPNVRRRRLAGAARAAIERSATTRSAWIQSCTVVGGRRRSRTLRFGATRLCCQEALHVG